MKMSKNKVKASVQSCVWILFKAPKYSSLVSVNTGSLNPQIKRPSYICFIS